MHTMKTSSKAATTAAYMAELEEPRKSQIKALHELIRKTVPKLEPTMIAGMPSYGKFHYKSKSGREGDWAVIMLASQKNYISLYICAIDQKLKKYVAEKYKKELPKASIGKSCIRFKKIEDIDLKVITTILKEAEKHGGMMAA